jgi:hypothetical protein
MSKFKDAAFAAIDAYVTTRRVCSRLLRKVGIDVREEPMLKFKTVGKWVLNPRADPSRGRGRRRRLNQVSS